MNKIYAVVKEVRFDFEAEFDIQAFDTMGKAEKYLQEACDQYRKDAIEDEWVIEEDGPDAFAAYEDGCECHNHYYFTIYELTA